MESKNGDEKSVDGRRYWAFISYSHADKAWADWLHRGLERYSIPKDLVGKVSPSGRLIEGRFAPVFRDREELPTSTDLGAEIERALGNSENLVVICSPRSAGSPWVEQEIVRFKQVHGEGRVLCVIVDGEPYASDGKVGFEEADECFPKAIRYRLGVDGALSDERTEPIAADAREGKDGKVAALTKLMAGLLGVGFDDLQRREQQFQKRRIRRLQGLSFLFAMLFVGAVLAAIYAVSQKRAMQRTLSKADLQLAIQQRQFFNDSKEMSYLARALRYDPENRSAAMSAWGALAYRVQYPPVGKVLRHQEGVRCAMQVAGDRSILTGAGRVLSVWSGVEHALLRERRFDAAVTSLCEWRGGIILAGTEEGVVHLLDAATLKDVGKAWEVGAGAVHQILWNKDRTMLALGAGGRDDGKYEVRDRDGTILQSVCTSSSNASLLAWSPSGKKLAVGGNSPNFEVMDLGEESPVVRAGNTFIAVVGMYFPSDEVLELVDVSQGQARLNLDTFVLGKSSERLPVCGKMIRSEDGARWLGLNSGDAAYFFEEGEFAMSKVRVVSPVFEVRFGCYLDQDHVLLADGSGIAQVRLIRGAELPADFVTTRNLLAERVAFSADGNHMVVSDSYGAEVCVLNAKTLKRVGRPLTFPGKTYGVWFDEDGESLHALGLDGYHYQVRWREGLEFKKGSRIELEAVDDSYMARELWLSPDRKKAVVRQEREVILIDTKTFETVVRFDDESVKAVDWSPDGSVLAVGFADQRVVFLNADGEETEDGALRLNYVTHRLRWSPDGKSIAAVGTGSRVEVYLLETGERIGTPFQVPGKCDLVEWSLDGSYLVSIGYGMKVVMWDPVTGISVAEIPAFGYSVEGVRFMEDGRFLVHGDWFVGWYPLPDLDVVPEWLPDLLESVAGMQLSLKESQSVVDADGWLVAGLDARVGKDEGRWALLYDWLVSAESDRLACVGAGRRVSELEASMKKLELTKRCDELSKEAMALWKIGDDDSRKRAIEEVREALKVDAHNLRAAKILERMGELNGDAMLEADGLLAQIGSDDASHRLILDKKLEGAVLFWNYDEETRKLARMLVDEVLEEEPKNAGALDLLRQMR